MSPNDDRKEQQRQRAIQEAREAERQAANERQRQESIKAAHRRTQANRAEDDTKPPPGNDD